MRRGSASMAGAAAAGLLVVALFLPRFLWAFYEWHGKENVFSLRGFADLSGSFSENPAGTVFYDRGDSQDWQGEARLLADWALGRSLRFEANALESVRSAPDFSLTYAGGATEPAPERSSLFSWKQHDSANSQAVFTLDTGNMHWTTGHLEVIAGRQPINLATTFYFTPNDFFAPFAAQTFYRVYKPGVDALRVEAGLGPLSQLSLVGVLGYGPDPSTGNGWSQGPEWDRTSLVGRLATTRHGFEWALLGGSVRDQQVGGGSIQGELFHWLGLRLEGHYAAPERDSRRSGLELTCGLEHRFANSLIIRAEQFYHGQGYGDIAALNAAVAAGSLEPGYLGRHYTALDASYEFSPLLFGEILVLKNWTDHSGLVAFNAVYSLSDESELVLGLSLPSGAGPDAGQILSEYGLAPRQVRLEYRQYF